MNGQVMRVRNELEGAVLSLVDCEEVIPIVMLRIEQAIRRAGLGSLLEPALCDLARVASSIDDAKAQVNGAVGLLVKE